jgi:hypothetical protein
VSDYRRGLAFKAGEKAARASKSRETCDRQRGTIYFDDWQDGYENASHHAGETND